MNTLNRQRGGARPTPGRETDARERAVRVEESPTRCPYCHDSIALSREAWVVCGACLGRHHRECFEESGCCASCGSEQRLVSVAQARGPSSSQGRLGAALMGAQAMGLVMAGLGAQSLGVVTALLSSAGLVGFVSLLLACSALLTRGAEQLRNAQMRLALGNILTLCLAVQVVFSLALFDLVELTRPLTALGLAATLGVYSLIQGTRLVFWDYERFGVKDQELDEDRPTMTIKAPE